jgi:hypothetical protein
VSAQGTARRRSRQPEYCANCSTSLRGGFCHACGQAAHNPVRHFGHAVEEVFESFWHLDGRIFRTLRDLPFPGRVANRYLHGHRVGYVAPMRLFLVLSLLTVLAAQLAVEVLMRDGGINLDGVATATTAEEVESRRSEVVAELERSRDALAPGVPGRAGLDAGIAQVNKSAEDRLAELRGAPAPEEAQASGSGDAPVVAVGAPAFLQRWLQSEAGRIKENLPRIRQDPNLLMHAYLSAVPKALFVLVPLFALLLKLSHLKSGRVYLEHLVVALYSHAWICMTVLVISLVSLAGDWLGAEPAWPGRIAGYINVVLFWSIPVYLLVMQKLVYGEGWRRTVLKFGVLGGTYAVIVTFAALLLILLSLAHV